MGEAIHVLGVNVIAVRHPAQRAAQGGNPPRTGFYLCTAAVSGTRTARGFRWSDHHFPSMSRSGYQCVHPTRAVFTPDHSNPANKNASPMPIWHGRGVLAMVSLPNEDRPIFLYLSKTSFRHQVKYASGIFLPDRSVRLSGPAHTLGDLGQMVNRTLLILHFLCELKISITLSLLNILMICLTVEVISLLAYSFGNSLKNREKRCALALAG